ncbi:MAG: hypothetical protein AAGF31_00535 [Planctomycetota bacterium]
MSASSNRVSSENSTESSVTETTAAVDRYRAATDAPFDADPIEFGAEATEASTPFIGQWRKLVSTTNWEKGRIICEWRSSLESAGAAAGEYSDEAWSQLVGGVTGQHVGRLRRVYQRFGEVYSEYDGLYWTHFQAACEWDDAEMWLEGALQNGWSVSQVRAKRWETVGDGKPEPTEESAAAGELVEDFIEGDEAPVRETSGATSAAASGTSEEPGETDSPSAAERREAPADEPAEVDSSLQADSDAVRPFANLPDLPDDLADAFEQFKLVILNHKLAGWAEVSRDDVLAALESLKQLAMAPSQE